MRPAAASERTAHAPRTRRACAVHARAARATIRGWQSKRRFAPRTPTTTAPSERHSPSSSTAAAVSAARPSGICADGTTTIAWSSSPSRWPRPPVDRSWSVSRPKATWATRSTWSTSRPARWFAAVTRHLPCSTSCRAAGCSDPGPPSPRPPSPPTWSTGLPAGIAIEWPGWLGCATRSAARFERRSRPRTREASDSGRRCPPTPPTHAALPRRVGYVGPLVPPGDDRLPIPTRPALDTIRSS